MAPLQNQRPVHVIGGGLAGCEAAWQIASRGVPVVLHEMRPIRTTAAHKTDALAELVCSNSFRSDDKEHNAVGLLHEEMRRLGSVVMRAGDTHQVPAGGALAVDGERTAGRHLMLIGRTHDERAEPAHLLVQEADRVVLAVVGAERVGADELGERAGLVRRRGVLGSHLVQHDRNAAGGDLPGSFGTGEPAADDVHRVKLRVSHGTKIRFLSIAASTS